MHIRDLVICTLSFRRAAYSDPARRFQSTIIQHKCAQLEWNLPSINARVTHCRRLGDQGHMEYWGCTAEKRSAPCRGWNPDEVPRIAKVRSAQRRYSTRRDRRTAAGRSTPADLAREPCGASHSTSVPHSMEKGQGWGTNA